MALIDDVIKKIEKGTLKVTRRNDKKFRGGKKYRVRDVVDFQGNYGWMSDDQLIRDFGDYEDFEKLLKGGI